MIRVVIADDHRVVRTGLEQLLATFEGVEIVGVAADGTEAVDRCASERPDVAMIDLEMPGMDGVEATRRIRSLSPDTSVVVFTSFSDRERIVRALDAGAIGYLLKDAEPAVLHEAIMAAARGEAPLDPKAAAELLADRAAAFTERAVVGTGARGVGPGREGIGEQTDRETVGDQREDRQGPSHQHLPVSRCTGPDAGGLVGRTERSAGRGRSRVSVQVARRKSDCQPRLGDHAGEHDGGTDATMFDPIGGCADPRRLDLPVDGLRRHRGPRRTAHRATRRVYRWIEPLAAAGDH